MITKERVQEVMKDKELIKTDLRKLRFLSAFSYRMYAVTLKLEAFLTNKGCGRIGAGK